MSTPTTIDRFWAKVDKTPGHGPSGDCWLWTASKFANGYGKFWLKGHNEPASRAAFRLFVKEIPVGLQVLHSCDQRDCVNPEHLRLGTCRDNMQDKVVRRRYAKTCRNTRPQSNSGSGELGVCQHPNGRWMSYFKIPGGRNLLKYFKTKDQAVAQRKAWEKEYPC